MTEPTNEKSAANVRSVVDFSSPEIVRLRADVARIVYERGVRSDLVDRATAAIALRLPGLESLDELAAIDKRADSETRLFERTDGRRGKKTRWETTNLAVADAFLDAGWEYPATRRGREPSPRKRRFDSDAVASASRSVPVPVPSSNESEPDAEETPTVDELLARASGFEVADLSLDLEETARRLAKRDGLNLIEARCKANDVRWALRLLKKLANEGAAK